MVEVDFQYLAPLFWRLWSAGNDDQHPDCLDWDAVLFGPAGYFSRQTLLEARLAAPAGRWQMASGLLLLPGRAMRLHFRTAMLDTLVDSPVCRNHFFSHRSRPRAKCPGLRLDLFGDRPELLAADPGAGGSSSRTRAAGAASLFGPPALPRSLVIFLVTISDTVAARRRGASPIQFRRLYARELLHRSGISQAAGARCSRTNLLIPGTASFAAPRISGLRTTTSRCATACSGCMKARR